MYNCNRFLILQQTPIAVGEKNATMTASPAATAAAYLERLCATAVRIVRTMRTRSTVIEVNSPLEINKRDTLILIKEVH